MNINTKEAVQKGFFFSDEEMKDIFYNGTSWDGDHIFDVYLMLDAAKHTSPRITDRSHLERVYNESGGTLLELIKNHTTELDDWEFALCHIMLDNIPDPIPNPFEKVYIENEQEELDRIWQII